MALILLAPLAAGLLALSCCAAPLQSKPQAVVTFPGELLSNLSDVELAEVRGMWPHGTFLPQAAASSRGSNVGLQAELGTCCCPCALRGAQAEVKHLSSVAPGTA